MLRAVPFPIALRAVAAQLAIAGYVKSVFYLLVSICCKIFQFRGHALDVISCRWAPPIG